MLTAFAHACYRVSDLERSIEFYRDKLGCTHAFDFVNDEGVRFGVYLKVAGRSFIELFTGLEGEAPPAGSFMHICLEVPDLEAAVAELRAKGVEASAPYLGSDNSWQSWITDPDGNRIELHCYTKDSLQGPWLG
ncbi:MAG: VOC family protein [Armatimonadetes bacterium]|jgi:lactoylglutathione lyase|nr:VOC family protein [Armatimonadota bacterium]MDI9601581.1 VOC family protein [Acidobacteriota bacterium]